MARARTARSAPPRRIRTAMGSNTSGNVIPARGVSGWTSVLPSRFAHRPDLLRRPDLRDQPPPVVGGVLRPQRAGDHPVMLVLLLAVRAEHAGPRRRVLAGAPLPRQVGI